MKTDTKNSGRRFGTLLGLVLTSAFVLAASGLGAAEKSREIGRDASRHHQSRVYVSWGFPYAHFGLFHLPVPSVIVGTEPRGYGGELGALDLDIDPEEAQIYLDGELIGTADNFDGFPEFLWLEEGTYDLVFYHPNYETIARQYTIYGGVVVDVTDNMRPGTGVRPEDLASKSTVNRDRRLQRERERQAEAERWERAEAERWERVEAERWERDEQAPQDDDVGRLHLTVWPEDTALYLNGHFLGTGDELSQLSAGLIIHPGKHMLEAVHPEYKSEEITISVTPGERVDLEIELKRP